MLTASQSVSESLKSESDPASQWYCVGSLSSLESSVTFDSSKSDLNTRFHFGQLHALGRENSFTYWKHSRAIELIESLSWHICSELMYVRSKWAGVF
jgi:hypothetical protein